MLLMVSPLLGLNSTYCRGEVVPLITQCDVTDKQAIEPTYVQHGCKVLHAVLRPFTTGVHVLVVFFTNVPTARVGAALLSWSWLLVSTATVALDLVGEVCHNCLQVVKFTRWWLPISFLVVLVGGTSPCHGTCSKDFCLVLAAVLYFPLL